MSNAQDGLQGLVRALGEAMYNEPGEKPLPMATADATEVIHAQLTENTGTHFLDSGMDGGRHWQQNQKTPPWEQPAWDVSDGYVTHNVANFMERQFDRDETCVALEAALYAFAHTDDRKRDSWLTCMKGFANSLLDGELTAPILRDLGLPEAFVSDVLVVQDEIRADRRGITSRSGPSEAYTINTYNHECHGLSQVLQGTNLGGPYAEYVFLQAHQGCDVRGGYTGPRVYSVWDTWVPGEMWYHCDSCGWDEAESCVYDSDQLLYQKSIDPFELVEKGWLEEGDEDHPALEAAYDADHIDGAVFHRCSDVIGDFGHVVF